MRYWFIMALAVGAVRACTSGWDPQTTYIRGNPRPTDLCQSEPCLEDTQCSSNSCKGMPSEGDVTNWINGGYVSSITYGSCTISGATIAFGVLGGILGLFIVILFGFCYCRKRRADIAYKK